MDSITYAHINPALDICDNCNEYFEVDSCPTSDFLCEKCQPSWCEWCGENVDVSHDKIACGNSDDELVETVSKAS